MDRLMAAAQLVQQRASRTRALVAVAVIGIGFVISALAYVELRSFFLERFGMSSPQAVATLTALPILALSFGAAGPAGHWVVRLRRPSWIESAAAASLVDRAELEELTQI